MSFLNPFNNDDADDASASTNSDATTQSSGSHARSLDDFTGSQTGKPEEVDGDIIKTPTDEGPVAGEWVREMFENAQRNPTQPTWIGYEEARNPLEGVNEVGLLHEELNSHMAVFGASGYGKSTLLLNMMTQWAYGGYGFCFIDPKGQDAYKLLQMLPEDRLDDVYWMEPGSTDYNKVIGMNFLHTHADSSDDEFDSEAEHVIGDLIPILQASTPGWGATMESVVQNITRKMLEDDKEYNLLDIYFLLNDADYREDLPDYYDDELLRQRAEAIANYDQDDIEPLLRRFQQFAESRAAREVVAHTGSDIDAHEIINDNKIIILRTSEVNDDLQKIIATSVMRRLWSVIAQRSKNEDHDPYFLVADEFGSVAGAGNNVEAMLSRGRSLGLSMTISTQQPSQLDDLQESLGNVKNFISFSPGDEDDARFISTRLDIDSEMLMRLPQYNAYANVRIADQKKSGPVRTHTFAPYPPLRSEDEVETIIRDIVNTHGQERITDDSNFELTAHPLANSATSSTSGDGDGDTTTDEEIYVVTDDADRLTENELLEVIFDAQLATGDGDPDSFTTVDEVERQLAIRLGKDLDEYGAKVSHALEQLPDGYLDKDLDDKIYLKLSPSARDRVFSTDSGESSSAGKLVHRVLLEKSYLLFRRLGYDVEIPRQEGRMPDGITKPKADVNPNTADTFREAQQRADELQDRYPRLYELFGTDELHIEPESVTLTKPKQPFKNLIKAMEQGRKCVYVVRDGEPEDHDFAYYARRIHSWIDEQKFAKRYDGEDRIFYNYSKTFEFDDGAVAVKRKDGEYATWRDKGDKIILESPDDVDEPYVEFNSVDDLDNYKKSDFTHFYKREPSKGHTVLCRGNGKRLDTYENKDSIMDDGFARVPQPFIPERELPEWPLPDDWDGYEIVIIPSDDKPDMSPQMYDTDDEYDDEYVPIFSEDDAIKSVHSIETDADLDKHLDIEPSDPTDTDTDTTNTPALDSGDDTDAFDHLDQAIVDETTENADGSGPREMTLSEMMELKDKSGDDATDDEDDTSADRSGDTGPDNATNADEVPVADPDDKPKSTTDVVKESDEVWNKPDEDDDDYNPAKDNTNYRTGYNEEYVSEEYTGGEAREADKEGEFDSYTQPNERPADDTDTDRDADDTTADTDDTVDEDDTEESTEDDADDADDDPFSI